jgi:glutamine---fructose-6-phosphate transaminase (isomerizing)
VRNSWLYWIKTSLPHCYQWIKRLEYRGYDSAGIAIINGDTRIYKKQGKLAIWCNSLNTTMLQELLVWGTHVGPHTVNLTISNAHPHQSANGYFTLIHNGIIENYSTLKKKLEHHGYTFKSETDTEVLVNLIEYYY